MRPWTVAKKRSYDIKCSPQTGGAGVFAGLYFTIAPTPERAENEVINIDDQDEAQRWFPVLKQGFGEFEMRRHEEGNPIGAFRLVVTRILSHETDTNEAIMKYAGKVALQEAFRNQKQVDFS